MPLFVVVLCSVFTLSVSDALAARNVNFVGIWTPNGGVAWTITHENRRTGTCSGRSALAKQGYRLVGCRVHGSKYSFTITYGASYKSLNTGVIKGNKLSGSFHDTNGTVETYTAVRRRRI